MAEREKSEKNHNSFLGLGIIGQAIGYIYVLLKHFIRRKLNPDEQKKLDDMKRKIGWP